MKSILIRTLYAVVLLLQSACSSVKSDIDAKLPEPQNPGKGYPYVTELNGNYYLLQQGSPDGSIGIYSSTSLDSLGRGEATIVWDAKEKNTHNVWSPELHRIDGKWYIYFEDDDGNTDNHQIFVLEHSGGDDPTKGGWTLHGPVITNDEWNFGIHPSSIVVDGRQYLLWSGWPRRRSETETQCIFIAEMENPWTLKSERILISRPELEWERQWINPDGTRTAYPIYVNENPEPFMSPDSSNVIVAYSASGIWTPYHRLGLIYAKRGSDLLNPLSWKKFEEPQFRTSPEMEEYFFGNSNISVINPSDGSPSRVFYDAKTLNSDKNIQVDTYSKTIGWGDDSLPLFGTPF